MNNRPMNNSMTRYAIVTLCALVCWFWVIISLREALQNDLHRGEALASAAVAALVAGGLSMLAWKARPIDRDR